MMRALVWLLAGLFAAGCAGRGVVSGVAERPVSERPVAGDAQAAARVHVNLGAAYFQSGRFGVALDEARIAQAFDPGYAPVYHLMGQIYMYLEDVDAARKSFEQAASLAPGDPEINNSYGWFLCATGQEREGLERLSSAARNPYYKTPARPLTNAGLCHLRLRDDATAEVQFLRAAQVDAENRQARFHLAAIAYRRGAHEAARVYLGELQKLAEPTPETLWLGILVARKLASRDEENTYATQLRTRFPTSREYEQYRKGQFE